MKIILVYQPDGHPPEYVCNLGYVDNNMWTTNIDDAYVFESEEAVESAGLFEISEMLTMHYLVMPDIDALVSL